MRVVGVLDIHRPALGQTILDLFTDLTVAEIGQEREAALGDAHDGNPDQETLGVTAKSGVSVDW